MERIRGLSSVIGLVLAAILITSGCASNPGQAANPTTLAVTQTSPATANTEFARMLDYLPYSFLEENDIWYSNPGALKKLHGLESVNSEEVFNKLSDEDRSKVLDILALIFLPPLSSARYFFPLDSMMVERSVACQVGSLNSFSINEGGFETGLIAEKVLGKGYEQGEYAGYTYYLNREAQDRLKYQGEVPFMIAASYSRIAMAEEALIIAQSADTMNGILDTAAGKELAVNENPACRALANSLGEVHFGAFIPADRILTSQNSKPLQFELEAAAAWEKLHPYEMAALAVRDNGDEVEWLISLYYADKNSAKADAANLKSRLESYSFFSNEAGIENKALSDFFEPGEPVITPSENGATLTIYCRYREDVSPGRIRIPLIFLTHDLLFLAPDPAPYIAAAGAIKQPVITTDPKALTFSKNMLITIGAEPGYDNPAHQQITFKISLANQSPEAVKNVKVTLSTMATNELQKPQIIQAEPENPEHLDFEPGQSETYVAVWKFDGSNTPKEEISRLVNETLVRVTFIIQNGQEMVQPLFPEMP